MSSPADTITEVRGVKVGMATAIPEPTGVSVAIFPDGARGAVEVRGGSPGTYHTDGLATGSATGLLGALFFSGGSLYGLDAARGIRRFILDVGGGVRVWSARTPLVRISGAVIFDLSGTEELRSDYEALGYRAALAAGSGPVPCGPVGAGRGARVGKLLGKELSMTGGQGSAVVRLPDGNRVGCLTVVNAVGNVVDPGSGIPRAGARSPSGKGWASREEILQRWSTLRDSRGSPGTGTVLVLVATDAPATRWELQRMAAAANDAVARCIYPAHMASDGDIAFAVSTNPKTSSPSDRPYAGARSDLLCFAAGEAVVSAVLRAVPTDGTAERKSGAPPPRRTRNVDNPSALRHAVSQGKAWP